MIKRLGLCALLAALTVWSLSVFARNELAVDTSEDSTIPTVLIWGDSLSAAYNLPVEQGWVALLQKRLGEDFKIVNGSISGETTAGGLSRLPAALEAHEPQLVLLALGANDGLRGQSTRLMQDNLEQMIKLSQDAEAEVLLIGIFMPENYGRTYTQRFSAVYEALADAYELRFIPFLLEGVALNDELLLSDGLHPNATAQPLILEHVWETLEPMIDSLTEALKPNTNANASN